MRRQILFAARDDRSGDRVLEDDDVVLVVQLDVRVATVGQLANVAARQIRDFWPKLLIEVGAQIGERAIELLVQPAVAHELGQSCFVLGEIRPRLLCRLERRARR